MKIVNGWKTLTTFEKKNFITGVWQGSKYSCEDLFFKTRKDTTIMKMLDAFQSWY